MNGIPNQWGEHKLSIVFSQEIIQKKTKEHHTTYQNKSYID